MTCPCGCGKPATTKKGYGGKGCSLRVIPREVRAARARAWALAHPHKCRRWGQQGGRKNRPTRWDDMVDRWLDDEMRPADALKEAYRRGYQAGYLAGARRGGIDYRGQTA
jgi:hypothetical protein